ncbi:hypothetical protein MMC13_003816 [Lambiella insularis]|nr:hypothetical protein [Lambiella insularis]
MAEIIGTISAVTTLVEFSGEILSLGYGYVAKVARAPTELRHLLREIANINIFLDQLQHLAGQDGNDPAGNTALLSLSNRGEFAACEELLRHVDSSLSICRSKEGQDLKNFGKRLLWPLREHETKNLMQQLTCMRDTLSAALALDSATALRRIESTDRAVQSSVCALSDLTQAQAEEAKFQQLVRWLCPGHSDPEETLEATICIRQKDTGKWFLETEEWKQWLEVGHGLFWVHGLPGCGKTVLSATVIEHLLGLCSSTDSTIVYFLL